MNTIAISQINFKGYDARRLKGFLMNTNCYGIADEMKKIGDKEGFKIYSITRPNSSFRYKCSETVLPESDLVLGIWAQDMWTIVKDKLFAHRLGERTYAVKNFFNLNFDSIQHQKHTGPKFVNLTQEFNIKNAQNSIQNVREPRKNNRTTERELNKIKSQLDKLRDRYHIPGGNIFVVKNKKGNEALVGARELQKYSKKQIELMYEVNRVLPLPQMDFHIDLFIRPLNKKRILMADDKLTTKILQEGLRKLEQEFENKPSKELKMACIEMRNMYENWLDSQRKVSPKLAEDVKSRLKRNGYKVIPVPGRIYGANACEVGAPMLQHYCNYMNANVLKNKDGELVYITNKSNIDNMLGLTPKISKQIGFSFENAFIESILPYVKKEHIYFVNGKDDFVSKYMLTEYQGGIHCVCAEVPNNVRNLNE